MKKESAEKKTAEKAQRQSVRQLGTGTTIAHVCLLKAADCRWTTADFN